MITTLIPIAKFPILAHLCFNNLTKFSENSETTFLVSKDCPITNELPEANLVIADIASQDHLVLLDWAFKHAPIHNWVMVQHADVFWTKHWPVMKLNKSKLVITHPYRRNYHIKDQPITLMSDVAAVYNKNAFTANNLSFQSGFVRDMHLSHNLQALINQGEVRFINSTIKNDSWLDGGHALTLEVGLKMPNKITYTNFQYLHFSQFFRLAEIWKNALKRNPITIKGKHFYRPTKDHQPPFTVEQWGFFSWMTSLAMDKNLYNEYVFPWAVFKKMLSLSPMSEQLEKMENNFSLVWNEEINNCLGKNDDLGIRQIKIEKENYTYNLFKTFM